MAKQLNKSATYLKLELEKELICAVCQDHYLSPKVLPCGHYYCKQCILKLSFKAGAAKSFACPECRKNTKLPEGTVDDFPTAFFVNRLKEMCTPVETICNSDYKCDICGTSPDLKRIKYCQKCNKFLCEGCLDSHDTGHHQSVIAVEELDSLQLTKFKIDSLQKICETHNEPLKLFCFDCHMLICRDCIVKDHISHKLEFNILAAMEAKKEISAQLKSLTEVDVKLTDAIESIKGRQKEIETQCDLVSNSIKESFKELHDELERHQQRLLDELREKQDCKLESLRKQEMCVLDDNTVVKNLILHTESSTESCSDSDFMCMQMSLKEQIQNSIHTHSRPIYPAEEADIGVEIQCINHLRQACKEEAKLVPLLVHLNANRVPISTEIDKPFEIYLQSTFNDKPAKCGTPIEVSCKTLHNGDVASCTVENVAHGEYCIKYTSNTRGRHEVTITNNGVEIANSPINVFVTIFPAKLQDRIKTLSGLHKPNGIVINSDGEIIVVELKGDIKALDKEGHILKSLKRTEHEFQQLRSIAIDEEDNIYFADLASNRIFKSNKDFTNTCMKEVAQLGEQGHGHIAVVGEEIMVCERQNKGKITVYDKELNYVRKITDQDVKEFCALHPDSHGNFYASIRDSSIIRVYNACGKFIKSFQQDKTGLDTPWSMSVSGQYMYIADTGMKKIMVLTKRGKFVSSFGHNLCAVSVDKDGFVYACNFMKGRIEIF